MRRGQFTREDAILDANKYQYLIAVKKTCLIDLIVRIQSGNCFLMLLRIPLSLWKYVVYIKLLAQCCMKMEVNIF